MNMFATNKIRFFLITYLFPFIVLGCTSDNDFKIKIINNTEHQIHFLEPLSDYVRMINEEVQNGIYFNLELIGYNQDLKNNLYVDAYPIYRTKTLQSGQKVFYKINQDLIEMIGNECFMSSEYYIFVNSESFNESEYSYHKNYSEYQEEIRKTGIKIKGFIKNKSIIFCIDEDTNK